MEPPKIIRDADPQEGRGCWMGCFGIGCLIIVVGFFGLLVGGWYTVWHSKLPLVLLERAIEKEGKVKIEGVSGSVSRGAHIKELTFLTVDDENWSELRGIKFDYNGLLEMASTGRFVIDQMSVESGTIYADIESSDDFLFSPNDLNSWEEFKDSDITEFRVNLIQVKDLKIINLETDYTIEIENATLTNFHATGDQGIVSLGELSVRSNMLEANSEPSPKWDNATRIRGKLNRHFSDRMKQDVAFVFDFAFDKDGGRRAVEMFDEKWVQGFTRNERSIRLTDFSPEDYFKSDHLLPSHIQMVATYNSQRAEKTDDDQAGEDIQGWNFEPGASFQLGKTKFEIASGEGESAPLRAIIGIATVEDDTFIAEVRSRDYFQKGRIQLRVGEHLADKTDWARVVFGSSYESLSRDEQRLIEASVEAAKDPEDVPDEQADGDGEEPDSEPPKAEAEAPDDSSDDQPPESNELPAEKDDGEQSGPVALEPVTARKNRIVPLQIPCTHFESIS